MASSSVSVVRPPGVTGFCANAAGAMRVARAIDRKRRMVKRSYRVLVRLSYGGLRNSVSREWHKEVLMEDVVIEDDGAVCHDVLFGGLALSRLQHRMQPAGSGGSLQPLFDVAAVFDLHAVKQRTAGTVRAEGWGDAAVPESALSRRGVQ